MSPISLGMDLFLVVLLLLALRLGLQLNGRLKALRDGQLGFAKAVAELDLAASRAEAGLKALKQATEDTHDELLTRIQTARGLIARLDESAEKAQRLTVAPPADTAALAPSAEPARAPLSRSQSRVDPRFRHALSPRPVARGLDDELFDDVAEGGPGSGLRRAAGRL